MMCRPARWRLEFRLVLFPLPVLRERVRVRAGAEDPHPCPLPEYREREEASCMSIGVVAIGRNEGERLRVCLESALRASPDVVYVDSGSTDGSVAMAKQLGVHVVELDLTIPFTAARARNAGFEKLVQIA